MAILTTTEKVNITIQKFQELGMEVDKDIERKMRYVLSHLINDQHNETRLNCYEIINQQNAEDVSNLNSRSVDAGLRWAQHVVGKVELED